eukprot:scaffold2469_cov57-Phaeocystis_antarctica.AAC.2
MAAAGWATEAMGGYLDPGQHSPAQHVVLSDEWQSDRHGIVGRKVAAMGLGGVKIGAGAGTVRHERYTVIFVKWMATVG